MSEVRLLIENQTEKNNNTKLFFVYSSALEQIRNAYPLSRGTVLFMYARANEHSRPDLIGKPDRRTLIDILVGLDSRLYPGDGFVTGARMNER